MLMGLGLLPACRAPAPTSWQASADGRPVVLTSFTVLADMARQVAGGRLQVRSITRQGAEIHGYEPTPSDLQQAQGAALILVNGLGLERWARRYLDAAASVPHVVLSEGIAPLPIDSEAGALRTNPHAWMSPQRAQHYVVRIEAAFSGLDPEGRALYRRNAEAYRQQLRQLDRDLRSALSKLPRRHRLLVTCEGAFSYLARDYGLEEAYLWPVNAESQITPRRMARVINTVRARQLPAVFCESTVNANAMREVARATGARFAGTLYVDSLSAAAGPAPTLLHLQRHNGALIVQGLAGTDLKPSSKP